MRKFTRLKLDKFLAEYKTDERVLDIGSGGSSYDRFFPNRLTADIDPKRNPEVLADVHNLPFGDKEFKHILFTEVLEHVKNPFVVESELHRVLEDGGRLILTTRFVYPIHDSPHDYFRYTKYGLTSLFDKSRWNVVELREESQVFSALAILLQRVIFQTSLRGGKFTKLFVYLLSELFWRLDFLVVKEFGDIKRETKDESLFSTGYYLVLEKKK